MTGYHVEALKKPKFTQELLKARSSSVFKICVLRSSTGTAGRQVRGVAFVHPAAKSGEVVAAGTGRGSWRPVPMGAAAFFLSSLLGRGGSSPA